MSESSPHRSPVGRLAQDERTRALLEMLGPEVAHAISDLAVVEVLLNADGALWVDRAGRGREPTGLRLPAAESMRIIRGLAVQAGARVDAQTPLLVVDLGYAGLRLHAALPPAARAPMFSLRRLRSALFNLDAFVLGGTLTQAQATYLRSLILQRGGTILVTGARATGKTALVNALIGELESTQERTIVIDQAAELRSSSPNHVLMQASQSDALAMSRLIRSAMRFRPDKIVVGDVRGIEAFDLLEAWTCGHAGGVAVLQAGSARHALVRFERLISEVAIVPRPMIAKAVHLVVFLSGKPPSSRAEVVCVTGSNERGFQLSPPVAAAAP